ncbi:hypothetical protein BGZ54_009794 [Gamsiella multidivaricata]|nr:hypothetical protein BGZ54_009794 [Gamsiella multidivaricata]
MSDYSSGDERRDEKSKTKSKSKKNQEDEFDENLQEVDQGEEEEDDNEDVYEVEKVVGHKRDRGVLSYHLKWKGYSDADNTWEREKSVFCKDLVAEYWDEWERAGGRRTDIRGSIMKPNIVRRSSVAHKASGSKGTQSSVKRASSPSQSMEPRKKVSSSASERDTRDQQPVPDSPAKKQKLNIATHDHDVHKDEDLKDHHQDKKDRSDKEDERKKEENEDHKDEDVAANDWMPPVEWTSWDEHLECVQTVERSRKKDKMTVHLTWKDGKDTEHPIEDAHQKCPQKLIQFYEKHLKFTQAEGEDDEGDE